MIFYFTGTGNSKYIADKISVCFDEELIDIAKAVNNSDFTYECSNEKYIGFVFPTYAWSIPYVVKEFVTKMELDNIPDNAYVFAINNCGASEGRSLYDLSKILKDKNISLNYTRSIVLPDNYIVLLNVPDKEEQNKMFKKANIKMANIINNITRFKNSVILHKGPLFFLYKLANILFTKFMNKTSKFKVNDDCVGCGLCADICNTNAIKIEDGKPVWVNNSCVKCLACINRCPVEAINYGSKTEGKERYVNPFALFDKTVEAAPIAEEAADEEADDELVEEKSISETEYSDDIEENIENEESNSTANS